MSPYDSSVGDSSQERSAAWSAAGAAIMLLAGGAAGVLWLSASHSTWQLALAVSSTVVATLGLYWMIAALIPSWPFPFAKGISADVGVSTENGNSADKKPFFQPMSHEEYLRSIGKSEDGN